MKKIRCAFLLVCLCAVFCRPAFAAAQVSASAGFGRLLADLLSAYLTPAEDSLSVIDADLEALGEDPLAVSIADHWKSVYLDPEYTIFLHGTDDPSELPVADAGTAHAFVVLGYELENGEMQEELKGRCDAAAAAAQAFPESILVCSGGATGKNNPDCHTEAGLMKDYLVETGGIEAERIYTDERAMTTAENAVNTFEILKEQGIQSMTIVTSSYHQRWGQVLYHAVGEKEGIPVKIAGNYCCNTAPTVELYTHDAEIAIVQLGQILGLSEEEQELLPDILRKH